MQATPEQLEAEELGSRLSVVIDCPVHYPAYGKRLFECMHGVVFPVYVVAQLDWDGMVTKHNEEQHIAERRQ